MGKNKQEQEDDGPWGLGVDGERVATVFVVAFVKDGLAFIRRS